MRVEGRHVVRLAITVFITVLIVVASSGWIWAGRHQPPAQAAASRLVLTLCVVAGLLGLKALWGARARRPPGVRTH